MINYEYLAFVQVSSAGLITDEWAFADTTPNGGGEYALVEYTPGVAPVRRSRLGGGGGFDEVADRLTVHCLGGTPAQAVAAYERLIGALDAAVRWEAEETSDTIHIRARIADGTVGELAAVVLGPVPGEPPASASAAWDQGIGTWAVRNVTLGFRRRGLLLLPTNDSPVTSSAVSVGDIATVSLSNHPALSPTRIDLRQSTGTGLALQGYVLTAGEAAQLQIINASSFGAGDAASSVADAANFARGGSIARLTAASAATAMSLSFTSITIPARYSTAHVFCNVRPGSAAATWDLQAVHGDASFTVSSTDRASSIGRRVAVPQTATVSLLYLGTISRVEAWGQLMLIAGVMAPAFPQTLDINTIVLLGDNDAANIIYSPLMFATSTDTILTADPRPLLGVTPFATSRALIGDSLTRNMRTTGDLYVQQRGAVLAGVLYAIDTPATAAWRPATGGTVITTSLTARRWRGWRVPQ